MEIGIIGAGKVGATLARLWSAQGYRIGAVYSRTSTHAETLAEQVGAVWAKSSAEVVRQCDLTLFTVSDDAIRPVAESIIDVNGAGKAVIHVSGALDMTALESLEKQGFMVGSLHPAFPFADVETTMRKLPGATFAVEASDAVLRGWLRDLVEVIDGRIIDLPPGSKGIYHAALVMASNYTVTLYALSERLLTGLGAERDAVDAALDTLMSATLENIHTQRIPTALTGPLTRADVGTLKTHIDALRQVDPVLVDLYSQLARQTYPLLLERGVDVAQIDTFLQQEIAHASDNT